MQVSYISKFVTNNDQFWMQLNYIGVGWIEVYYLKISRTLQLSMGDFKYKKKIIY